jgi:hypothetical protein
LIGWDQVFDGPDFKHSFLGDGGDTDEIGDDADAESLFDGVNDRSQVGYNES